MSYRALQKMVNDEMSVTKLQFLCFVADLFTAYLKMHQIDF